jgi:hypothetical protein
MERHQASIFITAQPSDPQLHPRIDPRTDFMDIVLEKRFFWVLKEGGSRLAIQSILDALQKRRN